jgi:hypothetical protein
MLVFSLRLPLDPTENNFTVFGDGFQQTSGTPLHQNISHWPEIRQHCLLSVSSFPRDAMAAYMRMK